MYKFTWKKCVPQKLWALIHKKIISIDAPNKNEIVKGSSPMLIWLQVKLHVPFLIHPAHVVASVRAY